MHLKCNHPVSSLHEMEVWTGLMQQAKICSEIKAMVLCKTQM